MNISKKQKTVEKFMKNMILLVAILLIASNLVAFEGWEEGEHTGTPGLEFVRLGQWSQDGWVDLNAYRVSRGTANAEHIVIPATNPNTTTGWPVTEIFGDFSHFTAMTSIIIPNTVTTIGSNIFEGCIGLTSITIPNSVTSIGSSAFRGCRGLTSVIFEEPSSLTTIGERAFYGCTDLTSITIPNGVTTIGAEAFGNTAIWNNAEDDSAVYIDRWAVGVKGNISGSIELRDDTVGIAASTFSRFTAMTSIIIPNSVTTIGNNAFSGCTGLTSIEIPSSVTSIGMSAFSNCTGLTSVTFESPSNLTSIGSSAFFDCTGLTNIEIPNSVTSIGSSAFSGCTGLASVTFESPSNLMSIGSSAFSGCRALTSIEIPNSVTSIGMSAFLGCNGLTSVTIGSSVTEIGSWAFGFTNLESITVEAGNPVFRSEGNSVIRIDNDELIIGIKTSVIPYGVTSIGSEAFAGTGLASISIPSSVTEIGWGAFDSCRSLTSVTFESPSNLTRIGAVAFLFCTGLTSITIPSSVTYIGWEAFMGCNNLTEIIIGEDEEKEEEEEGDEEEDTRFIQRNRNNMSIGRAAFADLPNTNRIIVSNNVTNIGESTFYRNTTLRNIFIPASVTSMGYAAFRNCPALTIYLETASIPAGWHANWNPDNRPVVLGNVIVSESDIIEPALATALAGNFPNPFNPETTIRFAIREDAFVSIEIYNIRGQRVRNLVNEERRAGEYSIVWNGRDDHGNSVASGVYFYRMRAGDYHSIRRMILMK